MGRIAMSKKTKRKKDTKLDPEEKTLLASVERGEWKTVANFDEELTIAKKAAANSLRKDARINIRLFSADLECIKQKAAYEGLPYQSLIASILHLYAVGNLNRNINRV